MDNLEGIPAGQPNVRNELPKASIRQSLRSAGAVPTRDHEELNPQNLRKRK
jgi:hypothetical protein